MKSLILLIIVAVSSLCYAEQVNNNLSELIAESGVLEDFWYGDDGESCIEPEFSIKSQDIEKQTLKVFIAKMGYKVGCYETYYTCELSYAIKESGHIEILPLDVDKSCFQR